MDHKGLLTWTMLLKDTGRYDEGSRGLTVVVEAGGLPGQPADCPNVIVRTLKQALSGASAHPDRVCLPQASWLYRT